MSLNVIIATRLNKGSDSGLALNTKIKTKSRYKFCFNPIFNSYSKSELKFYVSLVALESGENTSKNKSLATGIGLRGPPNFSKQTALKGAYNTLDLD